ncbi:MAG: nitrate- and nitrite sensing domain-containing protein [Rhizobiaceae bacterium]|nr:nitrate- and nitrite sensing domain-containing protein [Rhizobiaceae bacterium]
MNIDVEQMAPTIRILQILGEITHHLQIERGYTALFVDSDGEIFSDELRAQYEITDRTLAEFEVAVEKLSSKQTAISVRKLDFLSQDESGLLLHRKDVQQGALEFAQAINPYTYKYIYPTIDINIEIALSVPDVDPVKVSAYSSYLQWKERTGRERAWGSHGFCSRLLRNKEFIERMLTLIEEQNAYERTFMSLATSEQKEEVERRLSGYVMECLESIHSKLTDSDHIQELETLSPITWFELLTGKMDRMRSAEISLVKTLSPGDGVPVNLNENIQIPARLEEHLPIIRSLPAFSQLDADELSNLLKHADIRKYEKGKLLFMQGEILSRYYLILGGWVKLYKGTNSGEEAILQMLSSGDSLMEAAVFLNIPSLVSAQVVQNSEILSLPAPIIRESLLNNKKLALNIIGGLSMRSQGLIRQIEHSRLKTATERVGWFLLKLGMEQNSGQSRAITLPYDKSIIASYLDMTPETFSRTLKRFRNKGFSIQNDKISMPDPKALCRFCDETLAQACIFRDQPLCPQTYLD